jgi:prevent-host-death family protein
MRTVTAMDMRKRLGEILDAASAGERILIERDHKPLAMLLSIEDVQALDEQDAAADLELAALDELVAIGEAWRARTGGSTLSAEGSVRLDRDLRDSEKYDRSHPDDGEAEG